MSNFTLLKFVFCISAALLLASCSGSYALIGKSHAQLVDEQCKPVKNQKINVNNIVDALYISHSGHLSTKKYTTDNNGVFEFEIEKSADKLAIYIPGDSDVTTKWEWYWAVDMGDDRILAAFNEERSRYIGHPDQSFRISLLEFSAEQPMILFYPESLVDFNQSESQKYSSICDKTAVHDYIENIQRIKTEEAGKTLKLKKELEKPRVTGLSYGRFSLNTWIKDGSENTYYIKKPESTIKKEHQKIGLDFGITFELSSTAKGYTDITYIVHYPKQGLTDPVTGTTRHLEKHIISTQLGEHTGFIYTIEESWEIQPGEWVFQVFNKDKILAEQAIILE